MELSEAGIITDLITGKKMSAKLARNQLKGLNRTTTLKSLEAVIKLMYAESKEDFIEAYKEATHDERQGKGAWTMMNRSAKENW